MIKMELSENSLIIQITDEEASIQAFQEHKNSNQVKFFPEYKTRSMYAKHCVYKDTHYLCEISKSCLYLLNLLNPKYLFKCFENLAEIFKQKNKSSEKLLRNYLENYDFRILFFKYIECFDDIIFLLKANNDVKLTLQELNVLIDFHINNSTKGLYTNKLDSHSFAEVLIRYKLKYYSEDEIQDYSDRQAQLRIGKANPTEYELKKDWIFKKVGNEITLLGYKGEQQRVIIPKMLENGIKIVKVNDYEISQEFDEFLLVNAKHKFIHSLMYYDNGITVKNPGKGFSLSDHLNACKDWNVIEVHDPNFPCLKVNYEELFAIGYSLRLLLEVKAEFIESLENSDDLYNYLVSEKHSNNDQDGLFYPLDIEELKIMCKDNHDSYEFYLSHF